ncbi:formyltetrahydrofolate-dependent phosphoribosylglycinamide formyltransferase [Sphingobium wenxiniae]|uniref:Phosphoribosylglycinamide formyltransferase n=1 Tax=Sphingobium wenxiniae (strain DSM 21828 / CGMCC 1.7748 / JZ-1) TaxID=595605 RepID=A0A562KMV7_SPHWJ|nr:phosphoribosylglycinamide formyltransferase [Sphingobium wenxiniae]MBB6191744.1 formyltetrahydrofolate-dependent phosphoribosylglycinamide formyltransferase [Sphingobium wenxiniae]TWH96778.1 phosphoribosylglycinamide formyltransferase-1/phosphoribosylamine--glycine ligase/phosphoribosylglycinamide formyltransferase/phosphoribosylformylglycinamidine cyclo-ligase [Sphingobium wenxiniae]
MHKAKVAVLISGHGSNMAALLYAAKHPACPYEVVLVASNNPQAPGLALAAAEGVPIFAHSHKGLNRADFDALIDGELRKAGAEYVALAGYMRLLSPEFVAGWEGRMLNVHPSLLPQYKGLDTHQRAIDAGDRHGGCSIHIVTADLDDGPVLGQTQVAILPGDTAESLAARTLFAEHQLYPRVLADFVTRERSPDWLLDQVRRRALALPRSDEGMSHGMSSFGIEKGKKFAYFTQDHHGDGNVALLVKTSAPEEQAMLIDSDPDLYYRPAYLGPAGWVGIRLDLGEVDWDLVENRLQRSWRTVAPKKLTALLDAADQF